ncbi:nitrate ABC transporter ATPase [Fructobacillus sp. M2-14]|uniref:Nitrate ABC transporter ATPase n=1 Tax=Fructobacillus broussonetiae TaxID=2713173 RepID=A0ABS5QZS7_9LACO|nr:nitrate ABC transporter ATPase [Fructobacillus broussonetiae]MBS9338621.1 nitrate ABC transporter ATPase [Fructobacillus broussonetiae]
MTPKIETLLEQVNQTFPGTVMVRVGNEEDKTMRLDRAKQSSLADRLLVEVPDKTEADFVIGDELVRLLLSLNGIVPQIFFGLTFEDEGLDAQLVNIATRLHRSVLHAISFNELAKQGLMTESAANAYQAGIDDELDPEEDDVDKQHLFRILTMLDAAVFTTTMKKHGLKDLAKKMDSQNQKTYPKAFAAAKALADPIVSADLKDSRSIRKAVVRVFAGLDEILVKAELPVVNAKQYVTLTPVLSERQLNGPVKNLFEVFHSEMNDFASKEKAYVGLGKQDQQNTFVIAPPKNPDDRPQFFKELYELPVRELLEKLALPYILRK